MSGSPPAGAIAAWAALGSCVAVVGAVLLAHDAVGGPTRHHHVPVLDSGALCPLVRL